MLGRVINFPKTHWYFVCPECDYPHWLIIWPDKNPVKWYLQCGDCGQQYDNGIITGPKSEDPSPEQEVL